MYYVYQCTCTHMYIYTYMCTKMHDRRCNGQCRLMQLAQGETRQEQGNTDYPKDNTNSQRHSLTSHSNHPSCSSVCCKGLATAAFSDHSPDQPANVRPWVSVPLASVVCTADLLGPHCVLLNCVCSNGAIFYGLLYLYSWHCWLHSGHTAGTLAVGHAVGTLSLWTGSHWSTFTSAFGGESAEGNSDKILGNALNGVKELAALPLPSIPQLALQPPPPVH